MAFRRCQLLFVTERLNRKSSCLPPGLHVPVVPGLFVWCVGHRNGMRTIFEHSNAQFRSSPVGIYILSKIKLDGQKVGGPTDRPTDRPNIDLYCGTTCEQSAIKILPRMRCFTAFVSRVSRSIHVCSGELS